MKTKILTTLAAICVAGLFVPAIAQTTYNPPDSNNPAATPDAAAPPGDTAAVTVAPDAAPAPGAPDQAGAVPDAALLPGAPGAETIAAAPGEAAPAGITPPNVIMPRATGPGRFSSRNAGNFGAPETVPSAFVPPAQPVGANSNGLAMNFLGAPLREVLNYLSDAADFIIVSEVPYISGTVTIKGNNLTKKECVNLLNAELNRNGLAAVLSDDRTLTIMTKDAAKTADIPVIIGNIPTNIPNNAAMVTQIIPIKFVDAQQLVSDLSVFVSSQATIEANAAGNSIIITDTQANILHLMKIIRAIDDSAETETEVHTFRLDHASPVEVANELASIFPSSNGSQAPLSVAGGRGGRGGRGGGAGGAGNNIFGALFGGGGGGNTTSDRIRKAQQVNVVADPRIQAVVVTAPRDMMDQISELIHQLDVTSDRDQDVYVFSVTNADPSAAVAVLQSMFQGSTASRQTVQNSALQQRLQATMQNMGSISTSSGLNSSSGGRTAGN